MSVRKVTAQVNDKTYDLEQEYGTDNYKVTIQAPEEATDYNIKITAIDDLGNYTILDRNSPMFGQLLALYVRDKDYNIEKDLRPSILTSELGNLMLDSVAPVYDRSKVTLYLFQALGTVLEKETDFVRNDLILQMFPQTATWGLKYWEDEYGVVTDLSKTLEERRAYFMSTVFFSKPPMTPKRLEDNIKSLTGFDCKITERIAPNTFEVRIRGYVKDLTTVRKELDAKAPAHLIYTIFMAELIEVETKTFTAFTVSEFEHYELEVSN